MAKNNTGGIRRGDLTEAMSLLSRLPVQAQGTRMAASAWAWPVAGALIALISGGVALVSFRLGLHEAVVAGLVISAQVILTGAMHEDGLADCADGFWGGLEREKRLEIMKDSRIGTFGVIAIVLSLFFRWALLASLFSGDTIFGPLVAAAALSRVPMVALMHRLPQARDAGLSANVGRPGRDTVILAAVAGLLIALVSFGYVALPGALVAALLGWAVARLTMAKIGGQTGDVLGASQQITEIGVLMVFAALTV